MKPARSIRRDVTPIWIVLVVVAIAAALISDRFLTPNNVFAVLQQGVIAGIVALGMTVVLIGGHFDLSTGAVVMMAAVMALLIGPTSSGTAAAIVLPLVTGTAIGIVNGLAVYRAGANSIVATIGMQFLVIGATLASVSGQHVRAEAIDPLFSAIADARPLGIPLPVIFFALLIALLAA